MGAQALKEMLMNVSPEQARRGAVTASPSGENPNYRFDWTRDSALTMREVVNKLESATSPREQARYLDQLKAYDRFSWRKMIPLMRDGRH